MQIPVPIGLQLGLLLSLSNKKQVLKTPFFLLLGSKFSSCVMLTACDDMRDTVKYHTICQSGFITGPILFTIEHQ